MLQFDKQIFFDQFRPWYKKKTGKKSLSVATANGVDFLLDQFSAMPQWKDVKHVAYALATIAHETAWTFLPIKEYRAKAGSKGRANQDRYWLSGYYGRGYVQLTWLRNYQKAGAKLGIDLVKNPALALRNDIAFKILTYGMHEGWFTGKKLSDYINSRVKDYKNARKIINGLDKAATLAAYAVEFEKMLRAAIVDQPVNLVDKTVDSKPVEEIPEGGGTWEEEPTQEPQEFDEQGNPINVVENPPADAGEAAPQDTAKAGEPVVGGRPEDPSTPVESVQPTETSGWGAWASNVRAQWASLGIGIPALGSLSFLTNPLFIQIAIGILVAAVLVSVTVYLTSMYLKSKEKREREQQAHELTLKQLEINADPTKYNVQVVK